MLSDKSLEKIKRVFSDFDDVKAVYLFGSYADNKENRFSDIDLGILLKDKYDKKIKLDILSEMAEIGFCKVDLVILNEAPILMKYEIVKHNKLIYKKDNFDSNSYFSSVIRRYLDFNPFLEVQNKYFKERLLNGK
ncbi:type VII toxin-antitoxin system MntA family adenylyltransferase antitoxin [Thermohalobacter berrensis]|uniref:Polymerase beta nucleotidyltransferase domain-containing protein n=1 Tax=Thermohalobacter berrensis TaxID=99594 RepID=A0A419T4B9_9FIRM|nr:nucleotidyltransferase domain-containing protein [Thermohalobacter berrensis]RKD32295.1 hypothetical protein BET03_03010 [Thermohalobacter berrensis]